MKTIFTIAIAFLLSIQAHAQCPDSDKTLFPAKEMISSSAVFFAVNNEYGSTKHYASSIPEYADPALAAAKKYIVQRSGAAFQKKCKARYMYANYPEGMDEDSPAEELYNIAAYDVTYTVVYTFPYGAQNYDFEIWLDKDYNLISEDVLPSVAKNPTFDKLVDICSVLKSVKANKQYKGAISGIGIEYDPNSGCFCWQVQEHPASIETEGTYTVRDYYINANTGKLIDVIASEAYFFP